MQLFTNYKNYTYFRNTNSEESKKLEEKNPSPVIPSEIIVGRNIFIYEASNKEKRLFLHWLRKFSKL